MSTRPGKAVGWSAEARRRLGGDGGDLQYAHFFSFIYTLFNPESHQHALFRPPQFPLQTIAMNPDPFRRSKARQNVGETPHFNYRKKRENRQVLKSARDCGNRRVPEAMKRAFRAFQLRA
ncbi:unnamed protein product [Bursaphelenchus xylophilus]|uniref:(pine wood nematode) hypothetical protein n=1 Tax=Bursaphelenchus xylophilus TaxID=6326 RepID=A0A811LXZ1_BURXY|nr:unnamed protein product [Bursaphelenchus xylophilus]CAG9126218.1 unnamed protein product [Bursaphelenchus xylophilus]